jgi:hypothetical protein
LDGNQSDSVDCLILNPAHPNLVDSQGKFRIIFSDGCDAAIEVKPNLARVDELQRAMEQCRSVKRTQRSRSPLLVPSTKPPHLVAHSLFVPFYVFAMKAFEPQVIYREIATYCAQNSVPVEEQVDAVFVGGVGIIKNIKHVELNVYGSPAPIGGSTGWYFEQWGDATPLGILLSLEYAIPAVARLAEPIMKRVLTKIGKTGVQRLGASV